MRRWLDLWAELALALTLAGCAPPPIAARPALWRVRDRDTTIWLLGAIHALPPGVAWQAPAVMRAMRDADTLILEIPPADPQAGSAAFRTRAVAPGLPHLGERVPPADRPTLDRAIAASGQSAGMLDGFKTWAAALAITAGTERAQGVTPDNGVETVVTRRFAGKAIGALETLDGQLAMFDRLPEPAQRTLLLQAASDATRGGAASFNAWRGGDETALAATLRPLTAQPALERALVTNRNARWTGAIVRRMARPGRVLMVVGAGHLVGPHSVVAMLCARGLRVERIE